MRRILIDHPRNPLSSCAGGGDSGHEAF
ncbi:MAG TPA: hypothetical protein DCM86_11015 [Verrucomicrobiales bacterium]|nr:hypothetical protein [Verrucomicrobiales bacterium]